MVTPDTRDKLSQIAERMRAEQRSKSEEQRSALFRSVSPMVLRCACESAYLDWRMGVMPLAAFGPLERRALLSALPRIRAYLDTLQQAIETEPVT
jgi:hypothetical protein